MKNITRQLRNITPTQFGYYWTFSTTPQSVVNKVHIEICDLIWTPVFLNVCNEIKREIDDDLEI